MINNLIGKIRNKQLIFKRDRNYILEIVLPIDSIITTDIMDHRGYILKLPIKCIISSELLILKEPFRYRLIVE